MDTRHLLILAFGCASAATPSSTTTPNVEPEQSHWEPPPGTAQIFGLAYEEPDLTTGTISVELKGPDSELSISINRRDPDYFANSVVTEVASTFQAITGTEPEPIADVMLAGNLGRMVRITGEDGGRPMHVAFATGVIGIDRHVRLNGISRERDEAFLDACASFSAETPTAAPASGRQRVHAGGYWIDVRTELDRAMITYRLDQERATIRMRIVPSEETRDLGSAPESTESRVVSGLERGEVTVAGLPGASSSYTITADDDTWPEQIAEVPLGGDRTLLMKGEAIAPEAWGAFLAGFVAF